MVRQATSPFNAQLSRNMGKEPLSAILPPPMKTISTWLSMIPMARISVHWQDTTMNIPMPMVFVLLLATMVVFKQSLTLTNDYD